MASKFGFGLRCLKTGMDRTASLNRRSTIKVRDEARERSYEDAICTCGGMTKRCIIIFLLFEFMCELWHIYYSWGNVAVVQLSFDYSHTRIHSSQAYLFFIFAYMHIFACFYACMRACFDCWFSKRDTHIDTITWAHKTRIKIDLNVHLWDYARICGSFTSPVITHSVSSVLLNVSDLDFGMYALLGLSSLICKRALMKRGNTRGNFSILRDTTINCF